RLTGLSAPDDGRLTLVGDPERDQVRGLQPRIGNRATGDLLDVDPQLEWIVLDPAGFGIDVAVFLLGDRHDVARVIEDQTARRRGALVDRRHVSLFHSLPLFTR